MTFGEIQAFLTAKIQEKAVLKTKLDRLAKMYPEDFDKRDDYSKLEDEWNMILIDLSMFKDWCIDNIESS